MKTATAPSKVSASVSEDQTEEMELLLRIGSGDEASFAELEAKFRWILFSTIYRVLNHREDAEDVCQEVLGQIWAKAALYHPDRGKPLTWASTMARNRAIDRLRSKQRRSRLEERFADECQALPPVNRVDASVIFDAKENGMMVRQAVLQLADDQREAIELAYFSGLTQNQIADQLGESLGTVKARIRRAMMKLRNQLVPKIAR